MAAVSHWRPGMFVGGGDLVVSFEWDKKWFTKNKSINQFPSQMSLFYSQPKKISH